MAKHDTKITLSLGEPRLKEISEVLSNKTCNNILDLLAQRDATITEISQELKIPLNTAEYNVKKLIKADLIKSTSHWWSVKGKKMPIYAVSNKEIIISPKRNISTKYIAAFLITGLASLIIKTFTSSQVTTDTLLGASKVSGAEESLLYASSDVATDLAQRSVDSLIQVSGSIGGIQAWQWFLLGTWFAIVLFMAFAFISERKKRK